MKIFEVASEHNHELLTEPDKVEGWLHDRRLNIGSQFKDGMVFSSSIDARSIMLKRIEVQFGPMHDFWVNSNNLESLKGSPTSVTGSFWCGSNDLKSLKYAPKKVGKDFKCDDNFIESLEHGPIEVGSLYDCSNNKLKSLQYAPEEVPHFYCNTNLIESLLHVPKRMRTLAMAGNKIKTLAGIHKQITHVQEIRLSGNPIDSAILGLILIPELKSVVCLDFLKGHTKEFSDAIDIVKKYLGQGKPGVLSAQDELQDHDLDDFAHL